MQILLCAHETLIKLDQKKEQVFNIEKFIRNHFSFTTIGKSTLLLSYRQEEYHQRLFLVKWLYNLYKKSECDYPRLREHMLQRIEKPIRIAFMPPASKPFSLSLSTKNAKELRLTIKPFSSIVYSALKEYFAPLTTTLDYENLSLVIERYNEHYRKKLLDLCQNNTFKETYNATYSFTEESVWELCQMQHFYDSEEEITVSDPLDEAYVVLSAKKDEPICTIKSKYKKLAKQYHPDTIYGNDETLIINYTEKFQTIQNAFELIRQEYNKISS